VQPTQYEGQIMSDSVEIEVYINPNLTDEEYRQCNFPTGSGGDLLQSSGDFRDWYAVSPLTGAIFKITPIGQVIPNSFPEKRFKHGRIAGYRISVNVPACLNGHNRLLDVSFYQGAIACFELLRLTLAQNGCSQLGLDSICFDTARLVSATYTALYLLPTVQAALKLLWEIRRHAEALYNYSRKGKTKSRKVVYSYPPEAVKGLEKDYRFTTYVNMREWKLSAYIKQADQLNSFMRPLADEDLERLVEELTQRIVRIEVKVHATWLAANRLDLVATWAGNAKANSLVFNLIRSTLRLDENLRAKVLRKSTVATLDLSPSEKKFLLLYLDDATIRDREEFNGDNTLKDQKRYSDFRARILRLTKIDIDLDNVVRTKGLSENLGPLLVESGCFGVPDLLTPYACSRISVPAAIGQLRGITDGLMEWGPRRLPTPPTETIYRGPRRVDFGRMRIPAGQPTRGMTPPSDGRSGRSL
jgi:hypothetical protein